MSARRSAIAASPAAAPPRRRHPAEPIEFPAKRNFSSLSVRDLIDARDQYHLHLAHLENVVATAIGRYRIRTNDWYATHPPNEKPPADYKKPNDERTLFNSVVRPWSWPCVLVFVNKWIPVRRFGDSPDQAVPRSLFLPDGRVVPTCVVLLEQAPLPPVPSEPLTFPTQLIGGGYPVLSRVQGRVHVGSIACLVTDGHHTYALTNEHVSGQAGETIGTVVGDVERPIGVASSRYVAKKRFPEAYPGWPGENVLLNVDAGLVRVNDVNEWTAQVRGWGALDEPIDLTTDTITLDLIDCPVEAFGAVSGAVRGRIVGFFFRYQSVGGRDYVTDLAIAPEAGGASTHRGDSGTLWSLATQDKTGAVRRRPLAVQWGGHSTVQHGGDAERSVGLALATSLSVVCRELEVSVIRDWNVGLPEYWGPMGHYTIGSMACRLVSTKALKELFAANVDRVSYPDAQLNPKDIAKHDDSFVPLADVPDRVWKLRKKGLSRGGGENPNHFADMDRPAPAGEFEGKTLLDISADAENLRPSVWNAYYEAVGDTSKGCLPFRVWQFFDAMVAALKKKDAARFVCAAGILAHYVGDACQPLHISYLHDGDPDDAVNEEPRGKGVHTAYESTMLNQNAPELIARTRKALKGKSAKPKGKTGAEAAALVVALMRRTFAAIAPADLVDAYASDEDLWERFGDQTVARIVDGAVTLATIWESAYAAAKTPLPADRLGPVPHKSLEKLYLDKTFVPSLPLSRIGGELVGLKDE